MMRIQAFVCWIPVWIICVVAITNAVPGSTTKEFCDGEEFHAKCPSNQVLLMTSAQYGRMKIGRCVKADLGYLGCHNDVLHIMDRLCSGKKECRVPNINRGIFDIELNCFSELLVYLEVTYKCVHVESLESLCHSSSKHLHLSSSSSLLPSHLLHTLPCFSDPAINFFKFTLQASPGQQINLTMIDLGAMSEVRGYGCMSYGQVIEGKTRQQSMICGGQERWKNLIVSNSDTVEVLVEREASQNFILKYDVLGCPDLDAPQHGWMQRQGQELRIGCDSAPQTWTLTCQGNTWQGVIGNCSSVEQPKTAKNAGGSIVWFISQEIWLAFIVSLASVICIAILTFGIVCWRKKSLQADVENLRTVQSRTRILSSESTSPESSPESSPEHEYMVRRYRPMEENQTEDAIYDFCFSPGSPCGRTLPNNLRTTSTLPCTTDQGLYCNSTLCSITRNPMDNKPLVMLNP